MLVLSGSRIKVKNDFGFVSLDIAQAIPQDSGVYTCRAVNPLGSAEIHGNLSCYPVIEKRIEPKPAPQKILVEPEEAEIFDAPHFLYEIKDLQVLEGKKAYFETKLEPHDDPNLKIEWLKDNMPLKMANRIQIINDFGLVALRIDPTILEDQAVYTCFAYNRQGRAQTSARLSCFKESRMLLQSQNPQTWGAIRHLESPKPAPKFEPIERFCEGPPVLSHNWADQRLKEGAVFRLESRVEPANDPTMSVDWLFNGCPLNITGSRLTNVFEFGHISFILKDLIAPPSFVINLQPSVQNLTEGDSLHLEGKISSAYDDSLTVQWYHNDNIVQTGSRFKMFHEFGLVSLDITTVYPEDSGIYTCYAKNSLGEAYSQSKISCSGKEAIITQTDHPQSLKEIKRLEAPKPTQPEEIESVKQAPVFSQPLKDVSNIKEGEKVLLECHVLPTDDPELAIEW
uniref:Ig-like domain-containing protein n=1 Tax=Romanomermis culicivorax TaxID=13658 RepID=A0A915K311_ROMCU